MSTASRQAPRFGVGDWVSFRYGLRRVWAQVIEDRGPLGVNRRRLYRIRVGDESGESVAFEVPEDDLTPIEPDRARVIEYLKGGGLIAILRLNLGGGRSRPRVWLSVDSNGQLTHTFDSERGLVGGDIIPLFALQGEQIFTPKAEEVIGFLSNFELTRPEAEDVVRSVGTAP
jgi:hypothetical protein